KEYPQVNRILLYDSLILSMNEKVGNGVELSPPRYPFVLEHLPYDPFSFIPPSPRASASVCPERLTRQQIKSSATVNTVPWSETQLGFDIEESNLQLVTLPIDSILYHERHTQFPAGQVYPSFAYNWYSTRPFWTGQQGMSSTLS